MTKQDYYEQFGISPKIYNLGEECLALCKDKLEKADSIAEINQCKVISAMKEHRVNNGCFMQTNGYGYDDLGRDTLEKVYASVFHTEDALVRPQITCGTHALALPNKSSQFVNLLLAEIFGNILVFFDICAKIFAV